MTVLTTAPPRSRPRSWRSIAAIASIWSPSTISPCSSTAITRSASPSKAKPMFAPAAVTAARSSSGCVEPHASLMFEPSGAACSTSTSAPTRAQRRGRGSERRAVPAVDDDAHAVDATPLEGLGEVRDVVVERAAVLRRDPDTRPVGTGLGHRFGQDGELVLDPRLERFGELAAARSEELDAVVLVGVVTGRDHGRGGGALVREVRDTRRGEHTREDDVGAFRADARDRARLRASARTGACRGRRRTAGRRRGRDRGAAERGDELGRELRVRDASYAVGTETQSHGDAIESAISASSTAGPFGPS